MFILIQLAITKCPNPFLVKWDFFNAGSPLFGLQKTSFVFYPSLGPMKIKVEGGEQNTNVRFQGGEIARKLGVGGTLPGIPAATTMAVHNGLVCISSWKLKKVESCRGCQPIEKLERWLIVKLKSSPELRRAAMSRAEPCLPLFKTICKNLIISFKVLNTMNILKTQSWDPFFKLYSLFCRYVFLKSVMPSSSELVSKISKKNSLLKH